MGITDSFDIPIIRENLTPINQIIDPLDMALTKYKFHPSATLINERVQDKQRFGFKHISLRLTSITIALIGDQSAPTVCAHAMSFG